MEETFGIAAFRSRQQVMAFDRMLEKAGIATEIVNTPRAVAAGCGLSVRFARKDVGAVMDVCRRVKPANLIGVYRVRRGANGRPEVTPVTER